jgi:hypothetical protein
MLDLIPLTTWIWLIENGPIVLFMIYGLIILIVTLWIIWEIKEYRRQHARRK